MIQAAKIIGTGLATTGLIGAGIGIGFVFGALILGVATSVSLIGQLFSYAILGFAFAEATGLFVLITWSSLLYLYRSQVPNLFILIVLVFINSIRFIIKSPLLDWCYTSNIMFIFYLWCGVVAVTTLLICDYILGENRSGFSLIITFLVATLCQVFTNYLSEMLFFLVLISWVPECLPSFMFWLKNCLVPSSIFSYLDATRRELVFTRNWLEYHLSRSLLLPWEAPRPFWYVFNQVHKQLRSEQRAAYGRGWSRFHIPDSAVHSRICEMLSGYPRM